MTPKPTPDLTRPDCDANIMESAFATPIKKVLAHFNVNDHDGLTDKQVDELRRKHGRNCMSFLLPASFCLRLYLRIMY